MLASAAFAADPVEIESMQLVNSGSSSTIEGVAKNTSGKMLKLIFIKFKLYDDGVVSDTALAKASDIEPGERFKFKALTLPGVKFDSFKLSSVTAQ